MEPCGPEALRISASETMSSASGRQQRPMSPNRFGARSKHGVRRWGRAAEAEAEKPRNRQMNSGGPGGLSAAPPSSLSAVGGGGAWGLRRHLQGDLARVGCGGRGVGVGRGPKCPANARSSSAAACLGPEQRRDRR